MKSMTLPPKLKGGESQLQFRSHTIKTGLLKLKITTDTTRPEFFLTDGIRWKEIFVVLSRSEKHEYNQWVTHRCELFCYQNSEDYQFGNDPLVRKKQTN